MNKPLHPMHRRSRQRGGAALVVSLVLLFGMTLVAFFGNRSLIFEQRTSANQYRSTKAFEVAEAGLEWAVARLNDEKYVAAAPSCAASTTTEVSFAERYLPITGGATPALSAITAQPACSIASNGVVTCGCPTAANSVGSAGADTDPRFAVQFLTGAANGIADPWTVRIISRGCTSASGFCDPASGARADGVAVVTALYKMRPTVPSGPGAGLVTGAATNTGGNMTVINMDPTSNGVTINAGSVVNLTGSTSVVTLPGTPPRASVLDNDPSLRDMTNADPSGEIFFKSFFGESFAEYQANAKTWVITSGACGSPDRCTSCASANSCGGAVADAYRLHGVEKFWADTDISMNPANNPAATASNPSGTWGTASRPLFIASSAKIEMKGNIVAYGMFYAATATADENYVVPGTGNATVFGAIVSRSMFTKGTGTLDLVYDAKLFNPQIRHGVMVRLPGSWRDSLNEL